MQPPSWPPPAPLQPAYPFPTHGTPGVVVAFRVFVSIYAACCFLMVAYGVTRVTGLDVKWGLIPQDEAQPVDFADWAVIGIFCILGIGMLSCAFLKAVPSSWRAGLVALILGLPCCGVPAIVLLVLWCQVPTRLYFATHGWRSLPPPTQPPPPPMPR